MQYEMKHKFLTDTIKYFSEHDAPDWLTSATTVKGSTMDNRWFFRDHVLTLDVNASVETEFRTITRIE